MSTKICVAGAAGRMGSAILALAYPDPRFKVVSALEKKGHSLCGKPLSVLLPGATGGMVHGKPSDALKDAEVLIDFTSPESSLENLQAAAQLGVSAVIGTTGFDEKGKGAISKAAGKVPVVYSPNMSVGMNLLFSLVEEAARRLGQSYDVEIVEAHHKMKKDAPSGTALRLGESVARAWGKDFKAIAVHGREGFTGERPSGVIGFHAIRGGDIVGDHTVYFAGPGERLELKHQAHSREALAQGALLAALFAAKAKPGLYTMQDVLKA